ncbi:hypothetical protein SPSYN_00507 [Sporotomaculum syntrophicum]|uniref:Copper amine oxidase-like N-terminal domain-containing protein n=1 Tax=Sporotomaculum syntrophicum TaxID=182264 RepID=A0A9D2WR12_9FIRM|nr:stalk domain-containing protein [Sporotomaculum syntrophicum]KAF1085778.1 hypothetical protein SPSYN_00507 [Sporotomaculum syntrophicum]
MRNGNKKWFYSFMITFFGMLLLFGMFSLVQPSAALATSDSLEITGDGVTNPVTFTSEELEEMKQYQYVYSAINTWPTKKWYVGKGVLLKDLLTQAGIKEEAKQIKFTSVDGYTVTLTVKELFEDKRYRFPNFKTGGGDGDGHVPGNPSAKVEVEPIIGLISVEGSDNPEYMNDLNSLLLMLGQRSVTEQTGNLFLKYLNKIEVLTAEPEKWDAPQANPGSGTVPAGTRVTLSNNNNDDDKIYYTTDGSTPTLDSPMYNWIASRWWASRADVLGTINHPIGPINENTTIKAITIGPGKLDSDVVTFNYRVAGAEPADNKVIPDDNETPGKLTGSAIKLTVGRMEARVDGGSYTLEAAPYIDTRTARTLVPVRFVSEALGAGVNWDPETKRITITDGGKEIVLTLGTSVVQINGVKQTIDCAPATLPPGRTFVPLRFVSETLGAGVEYDSASCQILITR